MFYLYGLYLRRPACTYLYHIHCLCLQSVYSIGVEEERKKLKLTLKQIVLVDAMAVWDIN